MKIVGCDLHTRYQQMARITGVTCTNSAQQTVWQQTFGYPDAFGNLTKSGTSSFQPTYDPVTNRLSLSGLTVTYDGGGNLTYDGAHNYTWDPNFGNIAGVDTKTLTFDALGRMVEQASGSTYTQMVYAPTGQKLALMNGQTLQKAFIPLLGGAQAIYNSSGLYSYRHSDWLGSNRLTVLAANRFVLYDAAYAPFGETYNSFGSDPSFTGQNQDTASGLYDFMFREQSPVQGRWISPDPAGLAAVDPTNPQTWNRYAYVANNPLNAIDPLGLITGGDCGGPCVPFKYAEHGCIVSITYHQVTAPDGFIYDVPDVFTDCTSNNTNPSSGNDGGRVGAGAANNGTWQWIKNAARTIGNYIPVSCGAGAFAYGGANVGSPASLAVAKWYQWDSIDGPSKGLFTELSGGEGVTGGVGAQATPGQNTEYYAFVGPGVKNAGPFSGNVSGFVSTDFSSYGSQGFAAEGAFGRATGGVGVYMNFMSLTACMDKAH